jgi:hypothetical protein
MWTAATMVNNEKDKKIHIMQLNVLFLLILYTMLPLFYVNLITIILLFARNFKILFIYIHFYYLF